MDKKINISPNKINIPKSENEGIFDDYIQTTDKECLETFTCQICSCLAWDPVSCPQCDKIFCRSCRLKYGDNKICPFKCNTYNIREMTRNEKGYLNRISIKCTNFGCSKYIPYSEYKSHLEKCEFKKYHCKNKSCKAEGLFSEMKTHSALCKYRTIPCKKCRQEVIISEMKMHERKECPEIITTCRLCGLKMKRGIYVKEHKSVNNDNANCLKRQLENLSKLYKEEQERRNQEINELKEQIKDLRQKNEKYEIENNKSKKSLEEIKQYITNGYNKYILEDNKDKNIGDDDVLNINNEIKKKEGSLFIKENLNNDNNYSSERKYLKTDSNEYNSNNNKNNDYNSNTYKKESNKQSNVNHYFLRHLQKVPSLSDINSNNNKYRVKYKMRVVPGGDN